MPSNAWVWRCDRIGLLIFWCWWLCIPLHIYLCCFLCLVCVVDFLCVVFSVVVLLGVCGECLCILVVSLVWLVLLMYSGNSYLLSPNPIKRCRWLLSCDVCDAVLLPISADFLGKSHSNIMGGVTIVLCMRTLIFKLFMPPSQFVVNIFGTPATCSNK